MWIKINFHIKIIFFVRNAHDNQQIQWCKRWIKSAFDFEHARFAFIIILYIVRVSIFRLFIRFHLDHLLQCMCLYISRQWKKIEISWTYRFVSVSLVFVDVFFPNLRFIKVGFVEILFYPSRKNWIFFGICTLVNCIKNN